MGFPEVLVAVIRPQDCTLFGLQLTHTTLFICRLYFVVAASLYELLINFCIFAIAVLLAKDHTLKELQQ